MNLGPPAEMTIRTVSTSHVEISGSGQPLETVQARASIGSRTLVTNTVLTLDYFVNLLIADAGLLLFTEL